MKREPWSTIEVEGQRTTWAQEVDGERSILWLHGLPGGGMRFLIRVGCKALQLMGAKRTLNHFVHWTGGLASRRTVRQEEDRVLTGVPETYLNTNAKTIAGLRFILANYDFDYLLRTNTSTYVNRGMLADFVNGLPDAGYYGGFITESGDDRYASGACVLLSRDSVETILADDQWEFNIIDDVALGRSMKRAGVPLQSFNRIDVLDMEDLEKLDTTALRTAFVVRCKGIRGREHDVVAMRRVHALYQEIGLA